MRYKVNVLWVGKDLWTDYECDDFLILKSGDSLPALKEGVEYINFEQVQGFSFEVVNE